MKYVKKAVCLTLVVILVSMMTIPASALESEWRYEFRNQFPMLSQGSSKTGYVGALQSFLNAFPLTKATISNNGGVDGKFGAGTATAVRLFQKDCQQKLIPTMTIDGIAGGDTWACVAILLEYYGSYFGYNGENVMKVENDMLKYRNKYNNYIDFHKIVGYYPEVR